MDGPVSWVFEARVKSGQAEAFRSLVEEMVASARAEPGTLVFEFFAGDDGAARAYERFADPAAGAAHMAAFVEKFAGRLMAIADPTGFTVMGDPSEELRAAIAGFGPVYLRPVGGFAR